MPVHRVDNHRDAVLVAQIDELLKSRRLAKSFSDAEVPDWIVTPVNGCQHIRNRHHLDTVDPEVSKIWQLLDRATQSVAKLADHQLVDYCVIQWGRFPYRLVSRKRVWSASDSDRRQRANPDFP